jgi:hypothetical protein
MGDDGLWVPMWVIVVVDYSRRLEESLIMENIVDKLYTFELNSPINL